MSIGREQPTAKKRKRGPDKPFRKDDPRINRQGKSKELSALERDSVRRSSMNSLAQTKATQSKGKSLDSLPPQLYRAFRLGDWNIHAGQYFSNFDNARHTARPQDIKLEWWWPRWISGDWGYKHTSAFYWHAKDGNRVITYRELYSAGIGES